METHFGFKRTFIASFIVMIILSYIGFSYHQSKKSEKIELSSEETIVDITVINDLHLKIDGREMTGSIIDTVYGYFFALKPVSLLTWHDYEVTEQGVVLTARDKGVVTLEQNKYTIYGGKTTPHNITSIEVINENEYMLVLYPQSGFKTLTDESDSKLTYKVEQLEFEVGDSVWAIWHAYISKPLFEHIFYCEDIRPLTNTQTEARISEYILVREKEKYILNLLNYNNELYISMTDVFQIFDSSISIHDFNNNLIYDSDSVPSIIK